MSRPTFTRVHDVDAAVEEVFGVSEKDFRKARRVDLIPNALYMRLVAFLENSGAIELLNEWDAEDRKSNAGREALIPRLAVLTVFMLSAFWSKAYSFEDAAETIASRLTPTQLTRIGITPGTGRDSDAWYQPLWRATRRLRRLIDPWHHTGLARKLNGEAFFRARDLYDHEREHRAHQLEALIVRASNDMLPERYLEHYNGDVTLDSTAFRVQGPRNHFNDEKIMKFGKRNGDYQCGLYSREETNHDGTTTKKTLTLFPAYEGDTTVMADSKHGDWAFTLITGFYLHLPGQLDAGPRATVEQHAAFTKKRGIMFVDRAFNNLKPHRFQEPIRRMGFETAYDYKITQLGQNGFDPDNAYVIVVDGALYLNRMREEVRQITRLHAERKTNPDTGLPYTLKERNEIAAMRETYRLKPLGNIDSDGYQRFRYPSQNTYLAFDPATDQLTDDVPGNRTVQIKLPPELIRHLQKYPWQSEDWYRVYGTRNQVEASNKILKDRPGANLGDAKSRNARGFAFASLITTLGVAVTNLTRIVAGFKKLAKKTARASGPGSRKRRRTDSTGNPIPRAKQPVEPTTGEPPGVSRE